MGIPTPDSVTNNELLAKTAKWDIDENDARGAFAVFYARHLPMVLVFCKFLCGGRPEYEDLAQITFLRALRSAKTFRCEDKAQDAARAQKWLRTIALNAYITLKADKDKRHEIILESSDGEVSVANLQTRSPDNSELQDKIERLFEGIKERDRAVVFLWSHYREEGEIPPDILSNFCSQWQISEDNFRQIAKRTVDKIKKRGRPGKFKEDEANEAGRAQEETA